MDRRSFLQLLVTGAAALWVPKIMVPVAKIPTWSRDPVRHAFVSRDGRRMSANMILYRQGFSDEDLDAMWAFHKTHVTHIQAHIDHMKTMVETDWRESPAWQPIPIEQCPEEIFPAPPYNLVRW